MNKNILFPVSLFLLKKGLLLVILTALFSSCASTKDFHVVHDKHLVNRSNPYNPLTKMELLEKKKGKFNNRMHFLVFGDSKGNAGFKQVLKRADSLQPDFCITTADLVNRGGGEQGKIDYEKLNQDGGWFLKKYPVWPTVGNHESAGGDDAMHNFKNFFGVKHDLYAFDYGNARFIALPWPKIKDDKEQLERVEKLLRTANGKLIFIFKHRPHYTVGSKKYKDVDGTETPLTKLYQKYHVTAVFTGHDHIYYRTKRNGVTHIISAGAGAPIYPLKREKDAVYGDVYYGKRFGADKANNAPYKFVDAHKNTTDIQEPMYYVLSVEVNGKQVRIKMIDSVTGKVWDDAVISE